MKALIRICLGTFVLLLSQGCAPSPLSFRAVDGETGDPLPGVRVVRESEKFTEEAGRTNPDGIIPDVDVDKGDWITFRRAGYAPAQLEVQSDRLKLMRNPEGPRLKIDVPGFKMERGEGDREEYIRARKGALVEVPMWRGRDARGDGGFRLRVPGVDIRTGE
jgi:hypothetical protein